MAWDHLPLLRNGYAPDSRSSQTPVLVSCRAPLRELSLNTPGVLRHHLLDVSFIVSHLRHSSHDSDRIRIGIISQAIPAWCRRARHGACIVAARAGKGSGDGDAAITRAARSAGRDTYAG